MSDLELEAELFAEICVAAVGFGVGILSVSGVFVFSCLSLCRINESAVVFGAFLFLASAEKVNQSAGKY